ncbi:MAG TPA: outer membrane protein assembly factor BamB [Nevskiaceae bacterium]|nr:outer membrane protein assembly factor BamB [Nevskiaceae bacterium]
MKFRTLGVVALAMAGLLLAGCASKGIVHTPAKLVDIQHPSLQVTELWSAHVGDGSDGLFSGLRVAVHKDAVFVGSVDGDAAAFDPHTGKRIWEVDTHAKLISGPTVQGDQVLFGTLDARVIALNRATGKKLWTGKASSEVLAAPVSDGQTVVVRSVDGRVYGLNARDGMRIWSFSRAEPQLTLRGQSMPLIVGDNVLVGEDDGTLVALDLTDGKPQWQQAISLPTGRSALERLVDIDAGLTAGPLGVYVDSYGGTLARVDPVSGTVAWKRPLKSWSGMALGGSDDLLYVTDDDGYVWALDPHSGAKAWEQKALQYRSLSAPALQGQAVVVGDLAGYLHWLSATDGHFLARTRLDDDAIMAQPVVWDGVLYAMDVAGHLAAYRVKATGSGD